MSLIEGAPFPYLPFEEALMWSDDSSSRSPSPQQARWRSAHDESPALCADDEPRSVSSTPSLVGEEGDVMESIDIAIDEALEADEEKEGDTLQNMEVDLSSAASRVGNSANSKFGLGGLMNLGNTCYMASALQMLASLDDFIEELRRSEPRHQHDTKLRNAFMDVMERLASGETVRPDEFKAAVDERSSLFKGFRQQDAHEFLTTLLDLLDEDYKKKPQEEDTSASKLPCEAKLEAASNEKEEGEEWEAQQSSSNQSFINVTQEVDEMEIALPDVGPACRTSCHSFSQLDVNDIEYLLHGQQSSRETVVFPSSHDMVGPRYKLVGGRMNTSDLVLTPYSEYAASHAQSDSSSASTSTIPQECPSTSEDAPVVSLPSPVDSCFTTRVRVRLTCDSCKYHRCHDETFLHLSIEIGSGTSTVEDGIRRFFSPERRELKCEKCFCNSATQTMEILDLPKALLLHLKRFLVDVSADYSSLTYRKNQSAVCFDETLWLSEDKVALSEFLAPDCNVPSSTGHAYSIRSVVNHIGSSASCGHYTADAIRSLSDGKRQWTRFNDSSVLGIARAQAIDESKETAYMILYVLE